MQAGSEDSVKASQIETFAWVNSKYAYLYYNPPICSQQNSHKSCVFILRSHLDSMILQAHNVLYECKESQQQLWDSLIVGPALKSMGPLCILRIQLNFGVIAVPGKDTFWLMLRQISLIQGALVWLGRELRESACLAVLVSIWQC